MQTRILVVEDDQLQRSVLQSALKTRGYDVETASDGLEAVWKIREGSYDLVLIDYMLPEIDGMATARLIRDIMGDTARPRMIALTVRPDSVLHREAASGSVFDGVVAKSANLPDLLATVDRYLLSTPDPATRHAAESELLLSDWVEYDSVHCRPAAQHGGPRAARILVVEDDLLQQSVLKSALARLGYDVHTTADGLDAVHKIREHDYDLVIVDYQTPEIDGLAIARLVGAFVNEAVRPRLIALTATPGRLTNWEAEHGKVFDEIVAKSANLPALLATVSRSLQSPREPD